MCLPGCRVPTQDDVAYPDVNVNQRINSPSFPIPESGPLDLRDFNPAYRSKLTVHCVSVDIRCN